MKFRCELFGHFVYAEELSYSELLDKELILKSELSTLLATSGYAHIHFSSTGDFLLVQGVTIEYDQDYFHELCEDVQQLLDEHVQARILFVDRLLNSVVLYLINNRCWKENCIELPMPHEMELFEAKKTTPVSAGQTRKKIAKSK